MVIFYEFNLGFYEHYKGGRYEILYLVNHSESLEKLVLYKALYASKDFPVGSLWVRPVELFLDKVIVDSKNISRFKKI